MENKKPPFRITARIVDSVTAIAELVGRISSTDRLSASPTLRRTNRIRTIFGSLAIEQNTLTLEQVTAVINGRRVLAPPKDIKEVENAYEIYERMEELDPFSVADLLSAHGVLTRELEGESGVFRTRPVGVVDREGNILHFGTLPQYVPHLVEELFSWLRESDLHMLIRSCVFHYELELIHPFADGNGRLGRLWHTLLLSRWNPIFAWLPIESMIHRRQDAYYAAINASNDAGESTPFIEFMLDTVRASLTEIVEADVGAGNGKDRRLQERYRIIEEFLQTNVYITNADVRRLICASPATANRVLAALVKAGMLERIRVGAHWAYRLCAFGAEQA